MLIFSKSIGLFGFSLGTNPSKLKTASRESKSRSIFQAVAAQRSMRKFLFLDRFSFHSRSFLPLLPRAAGASTVRNSQSD